MTVDKSWQLGGAESLPYRVFDVLRRGLNRSLVEFLASHALKKPGARVLEAGSGPGFGSSLLRAQPNARLSVALDYDIEALREARRRDPNLPVVVADMRHLPFKSNSFDLVWNSSTLEHLNEQGEGQIDAGLREMVRVTTHGAHTFVGVPYLYGPLGFQRWIPKTGVGLWIGTVFSGAELTARLQVAGLSPAARLIYFMRFFVGVIARKD
jgi:SAM-dependent methyltransferase